MLTDMASPDDAARETSSATTRLVLAYVRDRAGNAAVARVLELADVPQTLAELEDPSSWVSYDARCRLFAAVVEVLDDPRAMFQVGTTLVTSTISPSLLLLVRALGSAAQVYRQLPRAVSKFSTVSTMTVLEASSTAATIHFELHEGYTPSRLDCDYARGLISTVPEVFGLPRAHVVHDDCQAHGHPACIYHVTWSRRHRWARGRRADDCELAALRQQLSDLQSASADLVASDDVDEVLQRITERAAASVLAQGYLLAVHPTDGGPPLVHATGILAAEVDALATRLLAGKDIGRRAVVVDVVSARRNHGRLAAIYAEGQQGLHDERRLLAAYASHAAAALDLLTALADSRRDGARSAALLALAHRLAGVTDAGGVAQVVVEALPFIVGCSRSSVLLWEPVAGELHTAATVGLSPDLEQVMRSTVLRARDVPELAELVTARQPVLLSKDGASPVLAGLLGALGVEHVTTVPLVSGDELLGVATASWGAGPGPADLAADVVLRLRGVADQAATALQGARLVSTVRHQALHDALTGLPNRVLFADRLEQALASGDDTAVLFCDLDRFKQVNDQLGHAAGDELLRQVAQRLVAAVPDGAVLGRLSGDEFAVLLVGDTDPEAAARALVDRFEQPFRLEGRELRVTTSVGVARADRDDLRADSLLRASDTAMYAAKQQGRNQISVAAPQRVEAPPTAAPSFEQELRAAIRSGDLHLQYQPVLGLHGRGPAATAEREVVAVEALVRWDHPRLGPLGPGAFVPAAEDSGLVVELDLWVLAEATRALGAWDERSGPPPQRVAVNLSGRSLVDPRLRGAVLESLAHSGLPPARLELEVVESRALVDLPGVVAQLSALRSLGVGIALDDFGTGFSTLTWLQELPADRVKLDRSFTTSLTASPKGPALVRGVLALARELGLEVVGEGVETPAQLAALHDAGCRLFQGYLLARPGPLHAATSPALLVAGQA
jgi:diguanylate cyclase (GGDEF)-like protein